MAKEKSYEIHKPRYYTPAQAANTLDIDVEVIRQAATNFPILEKRDRLRLYYQLKSDYQFHWCPWDDNTGKPVLAKLSKAPASLAVGLFLEIDANDCRKLATNTSDKLQVNSFLAPRDIGFGEGTVPARALICITDQPIPEFNFDECWVHFEDLTRLFGKFDETEKPLSTRERTNLLAMIGALAEACGADLRNDGGHYSAAKIIMPYLEKRSVGLSQEVIAEKLKEAREHIHPLGPGNETQRNGKKR